ncbi:MAG: radical SAM protein [Candidatus Omnitrophica bacterium]|nr:radical SAM protein [Candidatus Omnitrophota bacterium]
MNILLVKPYNLSDHIQPSLGLGYLAESCRKAGHNVTILDCIKKGMKADALIRMVKEAKPDVVGFQCYTFDLKFVKEALEGCKNLEPGLITVLGGPHPSAAPEESIKYFGAPLDFIFVGEAEKGLPILLDRLGKKGPRDLSDIPGLGWRENGRVRINPQIFVEDLDSLGMPAWDLIRPEEYPECQHGAVFRKFPIAPIIVTRGCPFSCTFCAGNIIGGKKIRKHSVDFILGQIKYLYDRHGIREFHIIDDNFTFDRAYAKELLRKLADLHLGISWATPNGVRIDCLDEEMLVLMKKSGLYLISLGIESGSDRVLALMKKGTTTDKIRKGIDMIRRFKIDVAGFFIVGFPGEKEEDIRKTIRFSLDLGLIRANYFTYLPFPGTASYKELASEGKLGGVDWDRFYFMSAPYAGDGLNQKQVKSLQREAFLRFYMRPGIMIKNILAIKSPRHFKFLLKRFFHWVIMK